MEEERYFKHSWALLTRDKGWIKPILVMTAASLVPIVGFFGIQGYALEWARLTAWGVESSPKQKNVDIGGCITSGARAFVVSLGLGLALSIITGVITLVFSVLPDLLGVLMGSVASMAMSLVTVVATTFILACQLRCAIYEQIGAGYRIDRVFEMVKRDTSGFARVVLLCFLCGLVISVVVFLFIMIAMVGFVPVILLAVNSGSTSAVTSAVLGAIGPFIFVFALFVLICDFLGNGILLIETTAVALWFRKFDVASWGKSEDPLPETGEPSSWSPMAPTGVAERRPEASPQPVSQPEVQPQSNPVSQPRPEPQPLPEADPQPEPQPQEPAPAEPESPGTTPVRDTPQVEDEGVGTEAPAESTPTSDSAEKVKDVDSLYADLYDVIQRDNHSDDK